MKTVHLEMAEKFSEDLFSTPPTTKSCTLMNQLEDPEVSIPESCPQTAHVLSPILEQSTSQSMDSTMIETPKRTQQRKRSRFLEFPTHTSTPAGRSQRQPHGTSRTPRSRYPEASGTRCHTSTPPQAGRSQRQPHGTTRTPRNRYSQEKQDKFPMSEKRFQRKVLMLLLEIKEELRRVGQRVEPDTVFHLSTLESVEELQHLERKLINEETRAAMVSALCKIGGRNLKDSARRMLDRLPQRAGCSSWPDLMVEGEWEVGT
ncbi:uncharacterized protein LOC130552347 isoform X7 [Triplophysa rosa]|uniref:uncharacterized protein LOC130552347 isoform X6 n=1 Tax=Triplophysa rosa TaxID=992332 RepID=UPI002545F969|nr:uncharacterized protein LOC130552347 isoform X6 [Triplophysa rosa]XP_057186551.1 uncharacterized protein LOC130552347 isoform X7 [Triplophysa rosa]